MIDQLWVLNDHVYRVLATLDLQYITVCSKIDQIGVLYDRVYRVVATTDL